MPRFRLSMAALLAIVAVIAIGLAGMTLASTFWTAAAATVTLALLLAAVLAACLLAGPDRAFCMGFALFGWAYLVLVNWDWVGGQFGHDLTAGLSEVAESLFPAVVVNAPALPPPPPVMPAVRPSPNGLVKPGLTVVQPTPPPPLPSSALISNSHFLEGIHQRQTKIGNFVQIGRLLLSLLFALLGGFIARTLFERRASATGTPPAGLTG